ncbi:unnamed protein product [Pseudo-nitzschia multistriata]|uniref:Uncharacterized protein n=1 Tax=Pseudo-nitzschia multistriata TaxID=183589 RepID=A0A448Z023_9STRA|nr:unnamed protein product [Pseudo-nitzschia multistriata]
MHFRISTWSAIFAASSLLVAAPLPCDAFVPSAGQAPSASTRTRLYYTMPDVTNMKAREIRQELESYGINTTTLFDKREFEEALIEARRHYESTINDVMSSNRPKKKKVQTTRRKTVNYQRGRHKDERIYTSDVNTGPQYHQPQQPQQQQRRQQQARPNRRRQYQAAPDPMGGFHTYPNQRPQNNGRGRRRPGNEWFEEDPLFKHEAERNQFHRDQPHQQQHYEEYEVGARHSRQQQQQQQQRARATYNDPSVEMKYQVALQESYTMKVEDLQQELNSRGISTQYCMVFKDFCVEYAKAIAENRQKVVANDEVPGEGEGPGFFGDDEGDYDPTYRDVVMQKYDPSMWI